MLTTKFQSNSGKDICITSEYKIVCNGVKKTSNTKKTTSHKLESQINAYSNTIGDISVNGLLKKQLYSNKRSDARLKLKAK